MSQLDSGLADTPRGVVPPKPKTNVYTVMLLIALVMMLMACVFLYLEYATYGSFGPG